MRYGDGAPPGAGHGVGRAPECGPRALSALPEAQPAVAQPGVAQPAVTGLAMARPAVAGLAPGPAVAGPAAPPPLPPPRERRGGASGRPREAAPAARVPEPVAQVAAPELEHPRRGSAGPPARWGVRHRGRAGRTW